MCLPFARNSVPQYCFNFLVKIGGCGRKSPKICTEKTVHFFSEKSVLTVKTSENGTKKPRILSGAVKVVVCIGGL